MSFAKIENDNKKVSCRFALNETDSQEKIKENDAEKYVKNENRGGRVGGSEEGRSSGEGGNGPFTARKNGVGKNFFKNSNR
ncbi:hypothetical protein Phum_PHUM578660 [Pediculus humanus corporis]|uniref:Uncharacterized protein n=1 Tax=Pediculus humanus subsp. corporis TaxID=121224 RepID=E0W1K9_PEDHC|nr:uncharacterized protein Phum_PHUM578660 [Pediculus humanus corporis]EEB19515.1 hypothetical protein Phum_PHUM578660 [Pediculus humanus corporis]